MWEVSYFICVNLIKWYSAFVGIFLNFKNIVFLLIAKSNNKEFRIFYSFLYHTYTYVSYVLKY